MRISCDTEHHDGDLSAAFIEVHGADHVSVQIGADGRIWINVNERCMFRASGSGLVTVENNLPEPVHSELPGPEEEPGSLLSQVDDPNA